MHSEDEFFFIFNMIAFVAIFGGAICFVIAGTIYELFVNLYDKLCERKFRRISDGREDKDSVR